MMPQLPGGLAGEKFVIKNGLDALLEAKLQDLAPAYATEMLTPLFQRIRRFRATGNDLSDLQRLLDDLPEALTKMKSDSIIDTATDLLVQTALIGRVAAMPDELPEPREAETPEGELMESAAV